MKIRSLLMALAVLLAPLLQSCVATTHSSKDVAKKIAIEALREQQLEMEALYELKHQE